MSDCKECEEKQVRIDQFETLIKRMAESADKLLKQAQEVKEKTQVATTKSL